MPKTAPQTVADNVESILRDEESIAAERSLGTRIGELVAGYAGSLGFVLVQIALVIGWVLINEEVIAVVEPFDPYPYVLLAGILALQSVLLACFVLMKQGHEARLSDRRSHLSLQVNLLVEKEVTKLIQVLERLSAAEGIKDKVIDKEAQEMARDTEIDKVVEELDRRLDDDKPASA